MELNINILQKQLCEAFCANIKIVNVGDHFLIETPFIFPDGDHYQIYLKPLDTGGFQISDGGHTLMHLSYENDITTFKTGNRNILFENIKAEFDLIEDKDNGEFYMNCLSKDLAPAIFKLGQALTKICDITFLNKARVQKTFYEDLHNSLMELIPEEKIKRDYVFTQLDNAENYPIDYCIPKEKNTFNFIFGVPNKDKTQLTTIILERILRKQIELKSFQFNSLIIFDEMNNIPKKPLERLLNVGDSSVTFNDKENYNRKIEKIAA